MGPGSSRHIETVAAGVEFHSKKKNACSKFPSRYRPLILDTRASTPDATVVNQQLFSVIPRINMNRDTQPCKDAETRRGCSELENSALFCIIVKGNFTNWATRHNIFLLLKIII